MVKKKDNQRLLYYVALYTIITELADKISDYYEFK